MIVHCFSGVVVLGCPYSRYRKVRAVTDERCESSRPCFGKDLALCVPVSVNLLFGGL